MSNESAIGGLSTLPSLRSAEFKKLSGLLYDRVGIKLPDVKRSLLESRTHKRLRALSLESFGAYCDYLFSEEGFRNELWQLIDAVTTNTTNFFRERQHFDVLEQLVVPQWLRDGSRNEPFRVWSAGCSTGEEPYTLGMVLGECAERYAGFDFAILATDVSTRVLDHARRAVYPETSTQVVPATMKRKYLLRGKGSQSGKVRVCDELRRLVSFERLNFMSDFKLKKPRDVIFCRNVIIYFDRETQQRLLGKFCDNLAPSGYLFIGHSENVTGMGLPLKQLAPATYQRI